MPPNVGGQYNMMERLTGSALLAHNEANKSKPKSDVVFAAGYVRPNGQPDFVSFYEALLYAKGGAETLNAAQSAPLALAGSCPDRGIYFACLASYNAGRLYGAWCDLDYVAGVEDIQEVINWAIETSPAPDAEEWAAHDYSGLPGCVTLSEWPDLESLADLAVTLSKLSDDELRPYVVCCDNAGQVLTVDQFRGAFHGVHESPQRFAMDWADEYYKDLLDSLPYQLAIDWGSVWRTLEAEGYSAEYDSEVGGYIITWQV